MTVPDFQTLMLPVVQESKQEISVQDLVEILSNKFSLSEEEKAQTIPSGKQSLIRNRTQWATTYLSKAGLIERPKRGFIKITAEGLKVLQTNPSRIDVSFLENYESFRIFRHGSDTEEQIEAVVNDNVKSTPEDLIAKAYQDYFKATKDELLDLILKSSPAFFEHLIIDLFKSMGYGGRGKTTHMGRSGDGGIDGIIDEDPLGLEKIYLQAKRYSPESKIQIDQIRSFSGTLIEKGARKGIFVTTSSFVSSAYDYVQKVPQSLILIDGNELTRLMYQYDVAVRTVDTVKLKKPDADYFEEV